MHTKVNCVDILALKGNWRSEVSDPLETVVDYLVSAVGPRSAGVPGPGVAAGGHKKGRRVLVLRAHDNPTCILSEGIQRVQRVWGLGWGRGIHLSVQSSVKLFSSKVQSLACPSIPECGAEWIVLCAKVDPTASNEIPGWYIRL